MSAFGQDLSWPVLARRAGVALVIVAATTAGTFAAERAPMPEISISSGDAGEMLIVDGRPFMVFGMNWDYVPIGQNYAYSLWNEPDDVIEAALAREMPLLVDMGVNAIRQYAGVPPRWVQYIYERYGIFTVLNHTVARYGFTLDGVWVPAVDYSDPRLRDAVTTEVVDLVEAFRDTPGVLMWLLGNENNYGLSWTSFEIEALPEGERDAARARHLYSLFEEITRAIKARDTARPVAIANGDVQYIELIAEECPSLDVFGTNVYRGISSRDLFQVVHDRLGLPVLYTEFGADAFDAKRMREDQIMQARYLIGQWKEIYEQSRGKGRVGNAIGGLVFQWSDGWWKFRQEERLDVHDTNASWPNGGYVEDYVEGDNNMNEEWWGITAKGRPDASGLYPVYPRAAYYALQRCFRLEPYAPSTTLQRISDHFDAITPASAELEARGSRATLLATTTSRLRVSELRLELETFSTGGTRVSTPESEEEPATFPAFQGFDQLQSFYAGLEAQPAPNVLGRLTINVLGDVPTNPIDEIFYENRGRRRTLESDDTTFDLEGIERVKVYDAAVSWDERMFQLEGFYRSGHYHWGYEGDLFGLYREAYYGENIDIYNGEAPVGVVIAGKRSMSGLTLAFGQELWWGANPAILVKARRQLGDVDVTAMFHEDLAEQSGARTSSAVPLPETRKATLQLATSYRGLGIEVGGIWSGDTKVGDTFQIADELPDGGYRILQDEIYDEDTIGGKARLTYQRGRWNWYAQAAYMGLVADGGPTQTVTYTGWSLKDTGSGNQKNVVTGLAVNLGRFQVSPNFLYQTPIVGPIPGDVPSPGLPRNVLDDPFAVRANRETVGSELMITYDPTPATWMWQWDAVAREDARLAASLGFVHRHLPTTQDAAIGVLEDGSTTFAFSGAPPARDLWEIRARIISRLGAGTRLVANLFGGRGEPNGDDDRVVERVGGDARLAVGSVAVEVAAAFDDWGPYDYHRDFNLTFPVQLRGDVSYSLGRQRWLGDPQTRFGVRGTWRSLDRYSPRYCPVEILNADGTVDCDPLGPGEHGNEWEIRTYVHFAM